jgi:hypothetical protein
VSTTAASRKRTASSGQPASSSSGDFNAKHPRGGKGSQEGGRFVRAGSSGRSVQAVQRRVGAKVDGKFGDRTKAAVRTFQRRHGLLVDGIVGRQTAAALLGSGGAGAGRKLKPGAMTDRQYRAVEGMLDRRLGKDRRAGSRGGGRRAGDRRKLRRAMGGRVIGEEDVVREEVGKPGTNWSQVTPEHERKIRPIVRYYMKDPKPFTSCVRDNTKRFGEERAKRVCAVVKDMGKHSTKWRNAEEPERHRIENGVLGALVEAGMESSYDVALVERYLLQELALREQDRRAAR